MSKPAVKFIGNLFSFFFWSFLVVVVVLKIFVVQNVTVEGSSMEPNYHNGEQLLVNQMSDNFRRGQVVALYSDQEKGKNSNYFTRFQAQFLLKRIIGLPGESVEMVGSKVIIYNDTYPQGVVLQENYITEETKSKLEENNHYFPKSEIPEDSYFVLGDNRNNSLDSRDSRVGMVKDYALFGQEVMRFWPAKEWSVFDRPEYQFQAINEDLESKRDRYRRLLEQQNSPNIQFR